MASEGKDDGRAATTYALGAVSRLTGLSPHRLRAWERRYGAVRPIRTPGGTRRYREADVARLRLLRAEVDAGHPIRELARLSDAELARRAAAREAGPGPPLADLLGAIERLDAEAAERLLALQLAALGPGRFATRVVVPLLRQVGERWEAGTLSITAEHLVTALVRNLLGSALRPRPAAADAARIVLTTLPGERHELGALAAAVLVLEAGAHAIYLGPDLPLEEVERAARSLRAGAVAVGASRLPRRESERLLRALRAALPASVELWVGGAGCEGIDLPAGVEHVAELEDVERKVALLGVRRAAGSP